MSKKFYYALLVVFLMGATAYKSFAVQVTFVVDMSREKGVTSVSLAGSFNGWTPTELLYLGNGLYGANIDIPAGTEIAYKFIKNGYLWELPVGACANASGDRLYTVPASEVILPFECFNSCGTCLATPPQNITFQVDMSNATVSANGVFMVGDYQGWDPETATPLTNMGNGVYAVTLPFYPGNLPINYVFLNDNQWAGSEAVSCNGGEGNRRFITQTADSTLAAVCFGSCQTCASSVNVTFQVTLPPSVIPSPNGIHITGDFQGWNPASTPMAAQGGGVYSVTVPLIPGAQVNYKFLNGNDWLAQEIVFGNCEFGSNRILNVPSQAITLDPVCLGFCDAACTPVSGIKVACIGNSITAGGGFLRPITQSYPGQLRRLIGEEYAIEGLGRSGSCLLYKGGLPYVGTEQFQYTKIYNPDIAVIKLGSNDSRAVDWEPHSSEYKPNYNAMIDSLKALPSNPKVFICLSAKAGMPNVFQIDENTLITQIRPYQIQIAKERGLPLIDLYDATLSISASNTINGDGIHPDSLLCAVIAARVRDMLIFKLPPVTVEANMLTAPLGDSYQWYYNGNIIADADGGTDRILIAKQLGVYKVGVKLASGNEDKAISDDVEITSIITGVENTDFSKYANAFPNPVEDELVLTFSNNVSGSIRVKIIDAFGRTLKSTDLKKTETTIETTIDMKNLPKGVYYLEFSQGKLKGVKKIVK